MTYEIVAFLQRGLLHSKAKNLISDALRQGASFVVGVDPDTVDVDIEASLQEMVELAGE